MPGGYLGGAAEYDRLKRAMVLSRTSALESTSWGLGQIMGYNASRIGYPSVDAMIESFKLGEDGQLNGFCSFINANTALAAAFTAENWDRVAFYYNGPNYAINSYNTKLSQKYSDFKRDGGLPNLVVRSAQARLAYLGSAPGAIDGIYGAATKSAVAKFETDKHITTATANNALEPAPETAKRLEVEAGF
jgi:hypothetical protein